MWWLANRCHYNRHGFFEAIGLSICRRTDIPDKRLREFYIDRIYDTFIDEDDLSCAIIRIKTVADTLEHEGLIRRGNLSGNWARYLSRNSVKRSAYTDCL